MGRRRPAERIVVGIDPSSKKIALVGTAAGSPPVHRAADLVGKGDRGGTPIACRRAYSITRNFVRALQDGNDLPVFAFIEAPIVGRGGARTTMVQSFVSGAIQAGLSSEHAMVVEIVYPSQWKKAVVGHGNATKPEITKHLRGVWPSLSRQLLGDQDLIDAACICIYGELKTSPGAE